MQIDIEFNSGAQLPMDAIPELAQLAEEQGFGCAWGGEANNKDPTVMLSSIAAVTRRMKIGSAVLSCARPNSCYLGTAGGRSG